MKSLHKHPQSILQSILSVLTFYEGKPTTVKVAVEIIIKLSTIWLELTVKKNSFNIPKGYAINKRNTDNRMARHKMTNNDLWNTTRNTKDWTPRTSGDPKELVVPAPLLALVMLLLNDTNITTRNQIHVDI